MPLRVRGFGSSHTISVPADYVYEYREKTDVVISVRFRIHRWLFCPLICIAILVVVDSDLLAAETPLPKSHSLIHRQATENTSADVGMPTATPNISSAPPAPTRQRKLAKRPAQLSVAAPSTDSAASQSTPLSSQPLSPVQTNKTTSENRISMAATGLAAIGASSSTTAPMSSAGTTGASSSPTPSSAKAPVAGALATIGAASTVSPGRLATGGRGLQSLTAQMPGLTQLVAPTITVSSPPSSAPPPSSSPPPPSSSTSPTAPPPPPPPPLGTGSAILSWTMNSDPNVAGYKIYVGTASGLYTYPGSPFVIGVAGSYTIAGLPSGQTYFFAISAFNSSGGESALSAEVSKSIY